VAACGSLEKRIGEIDKSWREDIKIFGIRILIQMVEIVTITTAQSTMAIGDFLLRRLREAGISQLFGVAGDFNLEFLLQTETLGEFTWVGICNELNAAYAADGYARLNGISGLIVTNGVGAWSAINGVGGAYSEHVPVVFVCGRFR
jgi:indolepyruvate decarboxylase